MVPVWLHCNICKRSEVKGNFHITNCGIVFCKDCKEVINSRSCKDCLGPCKRSLPLDRNAPEEVKCLFESVESQVERLNKCANWQDDQIRNYLKIHDLERKRYETFLKRYNEETETTARKKREMQEELDMLDRQEAYLEGKVERLEREKTQLQMKDEEKKRKEKEEEERESARLRRERPRNSPSSMFSWPKEGKTKTKPTVGLLDQSRFIDLGKREADRESARMRDERARKSFRSIFSGSKEEKTKPKPTSGLLDLSRFIDSGNREATQRISPAFNSLDKISASFIKATPANRFFS